MSHTTKRLLPTCLLGIVLKSCHSSNAFWCMNSDSPCEVCFTSNFRQVLFYTSVIKFTLNQGSNAGEWERKNHLSYYHKPIKYILDRLIIQDNFLSKICKSLASLAAQLLNSMNL
ncbi:hypothetical protein KIL84_019661 [Mauremys mutica]|uniref:Secreted protein n=1 Tax=Mauremys mutica TaxID=74926 RepID=A0A9D4B3I6_9SAUR|nr:hypothetical protein KIL84_019661 [Mauremys mutica]